MDRRDDERVPDELKEAAEWMREARTEPTPLQLDELKQRAHRQAARRGGSGARWRIRAVTTLLVGGLMMTSLTGVVLATGGIGSSSVLNSLYELFQHWNKPDKDPSHSQYCPPKPHSVSYTTTSGRRPPTTTTTTATTASRARRRPCPPRPRAAAATMATTTTTATPAIPASRAPRPPRRRTAATTPDDPCDPCKSSSISAKTSGGGYHDDDDDGHSSGCDPCKSSSVGAKTYTNGGNTGGSTCPKEKQTAVTGGSSNVKSTSATIAGSSNPKGNTTTAYFEWGKGSLGSTTGSQGIGNGTVSKSVSASLTGLTPNTTYSYRVVATSPTGGKVTGDTKTFKTPASPPKCFTGGAGSISKYGAKLAGTVNPGGGATNAHFEYGTSASSLGSKSGSQSVGSGITDTAAGATLSGLKANTKYYFRVAASNTAGSATGTTGSFTTPK